MPVKSTCYRVVAVVALLTLSVSAAFAQVQKSAVQSLERNDKDNTIQSIVFNADAQVKATDAQAIFQQYLGFKPATGKMVLKYATTTPAGITTERYTQYFKNIKMEYGSFTITSKNGVVSYMSGNFYQPSETLSEVPAINEATAFTKAMKYVGAEKYMWEDPAAEAHIKSITGNPTASYFPKGELVWVEDYYSNKDNRELHLAYSFDIYATKPLGRRQVFVDAQTGKVIYSNSLIKHTSTTARTKYSGSVTLQTARVSSSYRLYDSTRGNGVHTMNLRNGTTTGSAVEFTSTTNSWPTSSADTQALDAHWGAEMVYDFLRSQMGRNSWDNANGILNQYIHYSTSYDNAFWDGSAMNYGDGSGVAAGGFSPLTSLDVTAHEIGHGICQATANLVYSAESGGLNEGFSDCWGALVENWANPHETDAVAKKAWFMGEEIGAGVPLRRLDSPKLYTLPDTYRGTYWYNVTGCSPTSANDECGVHTNMGVISKWFYLITIGASGTNDNGNSYSVTGQGWTKAANILYQTELSLSSSANYAATRTTSISAATTLYGACSAEVQAVTNAWYAVGVGAAYTGAGYVAAISGASSVAIGNTITLTDSTTGGTWTSSNTSIATVSSTGVVTGVATGVDTIKYTVTSACGTTTVSKVITVSTTVSADIYTYVNSTTGVPSSVNSNIASYTNLTAVGTTSTTACSSGFSGISGFTSTTYTTSGPCIQVTLTAASGKTINVTGFTAGLRRTSTGPAAARLAYSTDGGTTWINNGSDFAPLNGSCATAASGTTLASWTTISASNPSFIFRIYPYNASASTGTVQVYGLSIIGSVTSTCTTPVIGAISGSSAVCPGATIALTDTTTGGTWTSSNTAIATVSSTGTVTGVSAGSVNITYSKTNSCGTGTAVKAITVNSATTAGTLSGASTVCVAGTTTLTSSVTGGTWSTSSASIASVSTAGVVSGVAAGSATISYTVTGTCGTAVATKAMTVSTSSTAGTISGTATVCPGATTTLSSTVTGGTWSISTASVATISASGVVTGVSAGTATVTYTVTTSCGTATATYGITVNAAANAGTLTGASTICVASNTSLTASVSGGTWSSSSTAIASVSTSGVVYGVSVGSATISYGVTNACGTAYATKAIAVATTPTVAAITGATTVNAGATITLSNTTTGGTWSATNARATVSAAGVVTGVSAGLDTIKYTVTNTCGTAVASYTVTVTAATAADIYTFVSSTTGAPTSVNTNIATYSSLTGVGTGSTTGCAAGLSGLTGFNATTFATSNPSVQVSLTAATGYTINVTGITAGLRRSSTGPAKARLAYSIDGGTTWTNNGSDYAPLNGSCATSSAGTTVASWTGFSVTNPSILVRIYPYNASASTGTLQVYGMSIIGFVNSTSGLGRRSSNPAAATELLNVADMMMIYPNPNNGTFNITLPENKFGAVVAISDVNGKIVFTSNYASEDHNIQVDLAQFAPGAYFVKAIVDGKVYNQQVQVQK